VKEGDAWGDRVICLQDVTEVALNTCSEGSSEKNHPSAVTEEEVVVVEEEEEEEPVVLLLWLQFAHRGDVWKGIMINVFTNPVIWGIAGGFFLSLTTIGPRFLKPNSDENVPGLAWFFSLTEWLGACK
jgi:predicted permease